MDNLIEDYKKGMSIKDLQVKYNKSVGSIYYLLKKNSISTRGYIIPYDNPFIIDSPERDYWLGWIFSDGHLHHSQSTAWLTLACLDKDILLKFKSFCGERAKFTYFQYITPKSKEKKIMGRVSIYSVELVKWFKEKYNLSNRKASTLNPGVELNWNILRGAFDGDGSFKKGVVITSISKEWIETIKKFYDTYNFHYTWIYDTGYRLAVYNKQDVRRIYHLLYDNATIYLKRKKEDLSRLAGE